MKSFQIIIASLAIGFSGVASATTVAPGTPWPINDPMLPAPSQPALIQVENPGHFADGIQHIIKAVKSGEKYTVIESKGSYDWTSGELKTEEKVLDKGLACESLTENEFVCGKNNLPVDGLKVDYTFACQANAQECQVSKSSSYYDWTSNGKLVTEEKVLLENGFLIVK